MNGESALSGTRRAQQCQCGNSVPPRNRKYCQDCALRASTLWKRAMRRQHRGSSYWLDPWLKIAGGEDEGRRAYNAYMRYYMRRYRLKSRDGASLGLTRGKLVLAEPDFKERNVRLFDHTSSITTITY
jgi:hypothetical protein